jgi:hypothetical protein
MNVARRASARLIVTVLVLGALAALSYPAVSPAAPTATPQKETALQRIQRMVARMNQEASTPEGEAEVVTRLSTQLRVAPEALREQHAAWGLGYGELSMVYGFARASKKKGVTPEGVMEMRRSGAAWEAIAKDLGVKIDAVASRMKRQAGPKPPKSAS